MSDYFTNNNELYHYGVKGMKWGVRRAQPRYGKRIVRGHGGPGIYIGTKRQLAGDKRDLDYMNKGGHLSVGLTKKRQAALDARDKRLIENRIAKNENKLANRTPVQKARDEMREANRAYNKAFNNAYTKNGFGFNITKKGRDAAKKRWDDAYDAASKANEATAKYKAEKKAAKALKKMERQEYKDFVKTRSKEILAGESAVGKAWDVLTDAHKYQAAIEYGLNKKAKTDSRYRD